MSEERTELQATKIKGVDALMQLAEEDTSLAALKEYVIVPFVKTIQGMSDQELKDLHGEGAVILQPGGIKIGGRDQSYLFVPLFFYTEFRKWADRRDTSQMIVESTYDPVSKLAKIARDHERWSEMYTEDVDVEKPRYYRYVEHLCFVGVIHSGNCKGTRCMLSFQKGDFRVGRNFASGIQMRMIESEDGKTRKKVPLWAQVWEMRVSQRVKGENKWWGIDPVNPGGDQSPVIDPELFGVHSDAFKELAEAHASNRLKVDGQDNDDGETLDSTDF